MIRFKIPICFGRHKQGCRCTEVFIYIYNTFVASNTAGNCHEVYVSSDVMLKGRGLLSLWLLAYRRDMMLIVEMSIWHI